MIKELTKEEIVIRDDWLEGINKDHDGDAVCYTALHQYFMAVAVVSPQYKDFAAYWGPVPGWSHADEWEEVSRTGDKVPIEHAKLMFPSLFKWFQWRE